MSKMQVITLYNTKGGSAKSTIAMNLGGLLADQFGFRVLLIDGDPQKTLSQAYPIREASPGGYRELLKMDTSNLRAPVPLDQIVSKTEYPNLDIIQCNIETENLDALLRSSQESYLKLRLIIDRIRNTQPDLYDFVLIDSSGIRGNISYVCAVAADRVLSPIVPDRVTVSAFFEGAAQLLGELASNPYAPYHSMPVSAFVVRSKRTKDSDAFAKMLRNQLTPEETEGTLLSRITLCATDIPESASYAKASTLMRPVHVIDPKQGEYLAALAKELFPTVDFAKQVAA